MVIFHSYVKLPEGNLTVEYPAQEFSLKGLIDASGQATIEAMMWDHTGLIGSYG